MSDGPRHRWHDVVAATNRTSPLSALFELQSVPLSWLIANETALSANAVTRIGCAAGLAAAVLFLSGLPFAAGAAYAAFLLLDCSDGAIARLRGTVSVHGADLDLVCDRIVLFAAVLAFAWSFAAQEPLAAWACTAYLAAHYWTDLGWLISERRRAGLPRQFDALRDSLAAQHPAAPRSGGLRALGRAERAVRPTPWVCNILMLLGTCLAPAGRHHVAAGAAIALLAWAILMPRLKHALRKRR